MAAEYRVRIYSRTGVLVYELVDYTALAYTREVNAPGMAVVTLPGEHAAAAGVDLDFRLEVWRRNQTYSLDWYRDFSGLVRDVERRAAEDGMRTATIYAPGDLSLLGRAIVGYKAATANRSKFTTAKAETVLKNLAKYNATSSGTTGDGRIRNVDLAGISLQADGAGGNTLDVACAWQNLLEACQDVAAVAGGDFDLIKTGAAAWEFRWYAGQRGTDRSATVLFALTRGNMANPVLLRNTLTEATVAVVGGQGEESARSVVIRTGANYNASYNATEVFVDARQMSTTAGLNAAGDRALWEAQARYTLEFDVVQTPSTFYGSHYDLGDLVAASFEEYSGTKKITGVAVQFDNNGEQIKVTMGDV